MKLFKTILFCLLLFGITASAQIGYGNNRNRNSENYQNESKPDPKEIEKQKAENINKFVAKLKEALVLDELQVIAITNEITSSNKNMEIVMKKESSEEDKVKEMKAITDRTEKTITSYFNTTQKEKYITFMEKIKNKK